MFDLSGYVFQLITYAIAIVTLLTYDLTDLLSIMCF